MEDIGYFNNPNLPNNVLPNAVAEMLGQQNYGPNNYSSQKSNIGNLPMNSRIMNQNQQPNLFNRNLSVSGTGHTTPTSGTTQTQNRGILPFGKASTQMSSQGGGSLLQGMSPTRGLSPSDFINMSMKPPGSRPNAPISRNQNFNMNNQSLGISAIGSESNLSALRQHPLTSNSSGLLDINEFPSLKGNPINSNGITNPFNFDQAEFPALAVHRRPIGSQPVNSLNSKPSSTYTGYESILKPSESPEFKIQSEDFPALPGSTGALNVMKTSFPEQDGRGDESSSKFGPLGNLQPSCNGDDKSKSGSLNSQKQQQGIQVLPDNTIRNIPPSMLTDQYGIVGLLAFIKAAETNPTLVHLALGNDLTTLGLNLNSPDNLYYKFQSPFSRQPCRPQDIDFFVPSEYLTNAHIRDKLAPIKLNRYGEDLLFYVYYTNPGDVLQLAAAAELYNRDWRYHKEEKIWITRAPGIEPRVKSNTYEQGTYYYFDCQNWRKVAKDFLLEYDKLEDRPHLPNLMSLHFNPAQHA